ncbi:putative T7SS-secreted protein [Prescottella soli]|uniref:RHS repeat-associated core domain-containing protein n=1 Tax=Prescottella soli TaxID=1543852 RepID=A0ABW9FWB6_9NOCA
MGYGWDDVIGGLDKVGDWVEDAAEGVVEKAGQVADAGLDRLAGVARDLGADGVADVLTDLGDQVASITGGAVDELELGQTTDPRELIRGDAGAVNEAVTTLTELGTNIGSTGTALRTVDAAGWTGEAADAFQAVFDQQPGLWQDAADAMASAAQTLTWWANTIESAQARAADAIERWERAEQEEAARKTAYNALSGEQRAGTTLVDSWTAMFGDAVEILRGARAERDNAASQIAGQLSALTESAPEEPPFTQRMAANLGDLTDVIEHGSVNFTSGLVTGLTGIVQFVRQVNPVDPYNISHPAEYLEGLSDLTTGLVVAAADPGAVVDAFLADARANPFEFAGALTGDALLAAATGGAGAGVAGARTSLHAVEIAGDLGSGLRTADHVVDVGRHVPAPEVPRVDAPRIDAPEIDSPSFPNGEPHMGVDDAPAAHHTDAAAADGPAPEHGSPAAGHDPGAAHPPEGPNPRPQEFAESDSGAGRTAEDNGPASDQTSNQVTECQDPVDAATGEFLLPETDLTLPGVLPLVVGRRHRSSYGFGRWFGPSWSSTIDMRVVVEESGVTLLAEDGVMVVYPHPEVGEPVRPRQSLQRWTLSRTETGGYAVHDPDRSLTWHFAPKPELGGVDSALGNISISAITDRFRNRIRFHYGPDGAPVEVSHTGGYRVLVDARGGRIGALSVIDPESGGAVVVRRFGYDGGHLTAVTNGFGGTTRYTYDADGRMLSWQDANGNRMVNTYDADGRVVVQNGTDDIMSARFDYVSTADGSGSVTVVTDSLGAQTAHGFDSDLRQRDLMSPNGSRTHTDYNERREPLRVTGPDGAVTRYRYTADGDVAQITRPDGHSITVDYAGPRRPVAVHQVDGTVVRQDWDTADNLVAVTDAGGARTEYTYHPTGAVSSVAEPTGARTLVECDDAGLPVAVTDPMGATTRITRDAFGRTASVTDPTGAVTRLRWSPDGKLVERTHPDAAVESWDYDGEGNLLRHTDPVGAVTSYTYGSFDLLASRTDPDGSVTAYAWDTERRLTAVTNPLGQIWSYEYDADGHLVAESDFNGARTTYTHDAAGRIATVTSATGVTRHHSHDILGRLVDVTAETGEFRRYTHDLAGRTLSAVSGVGGDPIHAVDFEYTVAGQLARQTVDGAGELCFDHDPFGRRVERRSHTGGVTGWRWNAAGRVASVAVDGHSIALTYDARGAVTGWRAGELGVTRGHDSRGRLTTQEAVAHPASSLSLGFDSGPASASRVLRSDVFDYRPDGYLAGQTTTTDRVLRRQFELDPAGRITSVVDDGTAVERYSYDALSNIVTQTATAVTDDEGGREYRGTLLVRDGRTQFHYDAAGRLIRKVTTRLSRKPDVWQYRYDAFDQMAEVTTPDGTRWRYSYDALGRRTAKSRLAADGSVAERTVFTWDATTLVEQSTSNRVTRWTYRPGTHTPLTQASAPTADLADQVSVDTEFYAIVSDLVGTPTELVDPVTADVAGRSAMSLWGSTSWAGTADTPIRFPGQYFDDETGLHYNLHRFYDPVTARYATIDPLGLAPSPNPNSYPHNPTVWSDPLGLVPKACEEVSRNAALNEAKRDAGIPRTQHPFQVNSVDMVDRSERRILDEGGMPIRTREYYYRTIDSSVIDRMGGDVVVIQEHSAGHYYGEGGVGDQGPHFNARPVDDRRNGNVPGTLDHYPFGR